MNKTSQGNTTAELLQAHRPDVIKDRLRSHTKQDVLPDAILGGIDGCVTTFAVVSGAIGADFSASVALVLGFANLFADAFSMAISNFEAINAQQDYKASVRKREKDHIIKIPGGEREEIRQIFRNKGFDGDTLDEIVTTITRNEQLWIDTMLVEEHGIPRSDSKPVKSAATTFAAFIVVGIMPLIPFLMSGFDKHSQFILSGCIAAVMFFSIGTLKSVVYSKPILRSGFSTLLTGGTAASLAFVVGYVLREIFGIV